MASQVALVVKNSPANARVISDAGSIPRSGRSPGTHTQTQRRHFHLENGSLHPQAGAGLTPCTLGLQGPLWEDVNSVPSLPQKRLTGDLLDPWSRAWRPGSVREAEGKPCGAGAETSPRTEPGSPEHSRQSSPLGCWGEIGVGGKHLQCSYQP